MTLRRVGVAVALIGALLLPIGVVEAKVTKITPVVSSYTPYVGIPTTYEQLYRCPIVGNKTSYIYHLRGSSYISRMVLKKKVCFATERAALSSGFRKSKV